MAKVELLPQTLLFPLPAVMVSCLADGYNPNIITISWIGIVNSRPPMLSISVRPGRFSHAILKRAGDFVVNLTSEKDLAAVAFCGSRSGREIDKFIELGLTPVPGKKVKSPMIKECFINLECRVRESKLLGSHEMFIADIVAAHADDRCLNESGKPDLNLIRPLTYNPVAGEYRGNLKKLEV